MKSRKQSSPFKLWRAVLAGFAMLLGISTVVLWCWYILDVRQQREYEHRFNLSTTGLGEMLTARMKAYEMVLRGVSAAFVSNSGEALSLAQWQQMMSQLSTQDLYPGISSVVWSRYLRDGEQDDFFTHTLADYRIFPEGQRAEYLPVKFVYPLNARTSAVLGLDLLTQTQQQNSIRWSVDNGQPALSLPLLDLYTISDEPNKKEAGLILYFPVYRGGTPPPTPEERRFNHIGMIDAAFRSNELVTGVFGSRLKLFHITAHDAATELPIFDSAQAQPFDAPAGWQPQLHDTLDIPLYGRTWRLSITSTPEYERALLLRSQDLVLFMGLSTAILVAFLAGGFVWQRDRQIYASHQVETKLREQAEQLMLANRYKSEFLANMSHELRTPLNSILILSDQLRQNATGNLNDKQTRHADIIYRAGSDLLTLINDVLDLSKVEAGRMQISLEPVNLQDILIDLDASMRPLAEAKGLHLYIPKISEQATLAQRVFTDEARLHQILRNLLSNAIKFTDAGQVQVLLSQGEKRKDGSVLMRFSVRDTGIGIAPDKHQQAFEAFQQLDGSTRRRHGGTGLGLAITRQLVKVLGGDIALQSAPGQGSTFTVSLPMQVVSALPVGELPPPKREGQGQGQALLIVEDDVHFAEVIVEHAHAQGFATVHCVSGLQALELLKKEDFAAIVLDILLPDISGWQLFRRLRAKSLHQHTPVHIISCLPQANRLDEPGMHYLTKPIERDTLEELFTSLKEEIKHSEGMPLLLVEDIAAEREHYQKRLTELGFDVTCVGNAEAALNAWGSGEFAVLVLDLNLPDSDGFTLLDKLDERRSLQGTRVVVNTGLDVSQEGLQRLSNYSAVVVRKKGDDTDLLGQAVQGFLASISSTSESGEAHSPPADSSPPPVQAPHPGLQGRRLLLVDDDIRNVYAMSALLDEFGFDISTASNGEEAIARFQQAPPDLILMDMSMPVMDGYTATNLLKTEYGCTIPIIALTAHAMKGDREKCLAAGADDYLSKPVEGKALRAMLELWLKAPS